MKVQEEKKYDYIIAGSGCAGLSLLYRILKDPTLNTKRILVLDKSEKVHNDRTWCYWEIEEGLFDSIVAHRWNTLQFMSSDFVNKFEMERYSYKMIQGIDFYNYVLKEAQSFSNVDFAFSNIQDIREDAGQVYVDTDKGRYSSDYVFNSTPLFHPHMDTNNSLLQHFEGWVIKTKEARFDDKVGTLMDFRLSQEHGATFMYVLPTSAHEALVEYTLFSEELLEKGLYKQALEEYIREELQVEDYEIVHKEFGVIPMSLAHFDRHPKGLKRIVNIGTAGGFTKASTGYTFQFIQKNTAAIVDNLRSGLLPHPKLSFREKMFQWYDRTLIEVILSGKMTGKDIFSMMFSKLSPETILAFLGNESKLIEDIKIMNSVPMLPFMISGLKHLR